MADSQETLLRQWQMLRCIPREPQRRSTSQILASLADEGHATTPRTVQRDLLKLSTMFGFTCDVEGRTQHWFWPRDAANIDLPRLDTATALVFMLSEQYLSRQLPATTLAHLAPFFRRAREVLTTDGKTRLARWPAKVRVVERGPKLLPPRISPEVQDRVFEAVLREETLRVHYQRRGAEKGKELLLNPLGLVLRDGVLYLVATAADYRKPVQFALHRMSSAALSGASAKALPGFSLERYLLDEAAFEYPRSESSIRLIADFTAKTAQHLLERKLSKDQEVSPLNEAWSRLTATVRDTEELRWWLLAMSDQVVVQQPAALRRELAEVLRRAASAYEK